MSGALATSMKSITMLSLIFEEVPGGYCGARRILNSMPDRYVLMGR
jgi:hypothetical protein